MKTQAQFKTQKEYLKYLVENKKELINFKRAAIKHSDSFSLPEVSVTKGLTTSYTDDLTSGVIKRTVIGNTYNWLDSHDDVHLDGTFEKSIKEKGDSIWHLHDHEHKITAKVGKPQAIYEKQVAWKDLGIDIAGKTTCLFMDTNIIKEYNGVVFSMYLDGEIKQHSVGMRYIQIDLAVNDAEMKQEFSLWNKVINQLGNKEKAMEQGFFWGVKEAGLFEISAVLAGSNELTPTVDNDKNKVVPIENYWDFYAKTLRA
jgi:hypothetical protein